MCKEPEELGFDPSTKNVPRMKRVERKICICIARLTVDLITDSTTYKPKRQVHKYCRAAEARPF